MEEEYIKRFILSNNSPIIFESSFQSYYTQYVLYVKNEGVKPVSKNRFSRYLRKYGFETKVVRNQNSGLCERIITMPTNILLLWNAISNRKLKEENDETKTRTTNNLSV